MTIAIPKYNLKNGDPEVLQGGRVFSVHQRAGCTIIIEKIKIKIKIMTYWRRHQARPAMVEDCSCICNKARFN